MNTKAKAKVLIATAVIVIAITASAAISVTATSPPTSYYIYGWVFYQNTTTCGPGAPCNVTQPTVIITNTNNSKNWTAETLPGHHYYELLLNGGVPPEYDVNATEILKFNATNPDGKYRNITCHTVTQGEINQGGLFNFNLTLHMCGDVGCNDLVNWADIVSLRQSVYHGATLGCNWAGDVNCDNLVNWADIVSLRQSVYHGATLDCCG